MTWPQPNAMASKPSLKVDTDMGSPPNGDRPLPLLAHCVAPTTRTAALCHPWMKIATKAAMMAAAGLVRVRGGVVHAYVDQKVMPPNLIVRRLILLKVKLWFITLP